MPLDFGARYNDDSIRQSAKNQDFAFSGHPTEISPHEKTHLMPPGEKFSCIQGPLPIESDSRSIPVQSCLCPGGIRRDAGQAHWFSGFGHPWIPQLPDAAASSLQHTVDETPARSWRKTHLNPGQTFHLALGVMT